MEPPSYLLGAPDVTVTVVAFSLNLVLPTLILKIGIVLFILKACPNGGAEGLAETEADIEADTEADTL